MKAHRGVKISVEQNTDVVQEIENDLDMDYEARLAEINKALEENARRMAEIEQALIDLDHEKPKIFTASARVFEKSLFKDCLALCSILKK